MKTLHKSILTILIVVSVLAAVFSAPPTAHAVTTEDKYLNQAIEYMNTGRWAEAHEILIRLEPMMSKDPRYWVTYGRYLLWQGHYDNAQTKFEQALKIDPDLVEAQISIVSIYNLKGQNAKALSEIEKVVEKNPDNVNALTMKGWVLIALRKFDDAILVFDASLELDPDNTDALEGTGKCYEFKRRYLMAEEYYLAVLDVAPNDISTILALAGMYQKDARYAEAIAAYNLAKEIDPTNPDIQPRIDLLEKWTIGIDERIRDINRRILWNNKDVQSHLTLAKTFMWKQDLDQAKKAYQQGLESNPNDPVLWYSLGEIYEAEGDWLTARENYEKALQLDPDYVEAEMALENLKLTYRPRFTLTYNFNRSARYDDWLGFTRTISRDDVGTLKYTQPIRPWLELSAGYSYMLAREIDRTLGFRDYMIERQSPHFEANFNLPYDIDILASYDLHIYANRMTSRFSLRNTEFRHGAFFSLQKYIWHNTLGFQYMRDFYTDFFTGELLIEASNTYMISDNISFNEYITLLVAMALSDRSNADTSLEYRFRPKFRMPFYDNLYLEYEFKFADHPNRYEHSWVAGIQEEPLRWLMLDISYRGTYYTLVGKISHSGVFSFIFSPTNKLQFTVDATVNYFDRDIGQYYVGSMMIIF